MDYVAMDYDELNGMDFYDYGQMSSTSEQQSWSEIYNGCVRPSLQQIYSYIIFMIAGSLMYRILCYSVRCLRISQEFCHAGSMLCGFGVLFLAIGLEFLFVLLLCLLSYAFITIVHWKKFRNIGVIVTVTTITMHLVYEMMWSQPEAWHRIRGVQMVVTMKVVSFSFDLEGSEVKIMDDKKISLKVVPGIIPYLGYMFCPATCILGPWITFHCYLRSTQAVSNGMRWISWTVANTLVALCFLCISNCIESLWSGNSWKWLAAYRDASSVRCSHYFICFVSQATLAAAGVNLKDTTEDQSPFFGQMVTKPLNIEFPRSISSLVRDWNIPMHDWLKYYIYRKIRMRTNNYGFALISTYVVSSLLHGLHFRIYMVLMSLAIFAFAEQLLRSKLATVFNACLTANCCKYPCRYALCPKTSKWKKTIFIYIGNLIFGVVTVTHLAYLGIMLNNPNTSAYEENPDVQSKTSQILEDLQKWSNLNYLSHIVAVAFYICYYLI